MTLTRKKCCCGCEGCATDSPPGTEHIATLTGFAGKAGPAYCDCGGLNDTFVLTKPAEPRMPSVYAAGTCDLITNVCLLGSYVSDLGDLCADGNFLIDLITYKNVSIFGTSYILNLRVFHKFVQPTFGLPTFYGVTLFAKSSATPWSCAAINTPLDRVFDLPTSCLTASPNGDSLSYSCCPGTGDPPCDSTAATCQIEAPS